MTLRNAPLSGRDARINAPDLPDVLSEIFLQTGLDRRVAKLPDGQITPIKSPARRTASNTPAATKGLIGLIG